MLSVQNYRMTQPRAIAFKQNEEQAQDTTQKPFVTRSGLKTGATYATIGAANLLALSALGKGLFNWGKKNMEELAEELGREGLEEAGELKATLKESESALKSLGKHLWITIPLCFALHLGCGSLVDKITNDKRAKFAQEIENKDKKDIVRDNPDAELTRSGNIYHKTNTGLKFGALIGAVALPLESYISKLLTKSKNPVGIIGNVITGAIGGLILGSIADHFANKGAAKHADKMAEA